MLNPTTAEVVFENDAGEPVLLKNKYGKGTVYFLDIPMELLAFDGTDLYNTMPYYKIYKKIAKDIILDKIVTVDDRNIGITINPIDENNCYATILNYSDKEIKPDIKIKWGWKIKEVVYGNTDCISKCDGVFLKISKQ